MHVPKQVTAPTNDDRDPTVAPSAPRAIAIWWANQIAAPTFDNGDTTAYGPLTSVLGGMVAEQHPVTSDQLAKFTDLLEQHVTAELDAAVDRAAKVPALRPRVILSVDYGPGLALSEAAEAAGIDGSRFPWKTVSWTEPDHVTVSAGYGAQVRLIWAAPGWVRPPCGRHGYEMDPDGRPVFYDSVCGLLKYHDGDHGNWRPDPERCVTCGLTYAGHYNAETQDHSWSPMLAEGVEP